MSYSSVLYYAEDAMPYWLHTDMESEQNVTYRHTNIFICFRGTLA